tara:strand:- start:1666 stop:2280 length:615 start_codon:yes stop_codon:yes gene_type:complete
MARRKSSAFRSWNVNQRRFLKPIEDAETAMGGFKQRFGNLSTGNIYGGVLNPYRDTQTDFENVYEDMIGVDTTATDLATKEFQENLATTLDQMQKMGMVNVQELANAAMKQSEQTRAGISAQTREADMLRVQGAEKVQTKEQQAELKIAEGAHMAEMTRLQGAADARNLEYQKTQGLMALQAGELESLRADRLARRNWFVRVFG